jgi:hypothetical protein
MSIMSKPTEVMAEKTHTLTKFDHWENWENWENQEKKTSHP